MNTRGKGEGTVYQTKDGRFVASTSVSIGGVRQRTLKYCKTKREAQDALHVLRQQSAGKNRLRNDRTCGEWFDEWLGIILETRRSTTHLRYKRLLDAHTKPLHRKRLDKLDAETLRTFYKSINTTAHTKYGLHTVIKSCLMEAWRREYVLENVARRVKIDRPEPAEVPSLTISQAKAFLKAIKGNRYEAVYAVAIGTGMNSAEVFGLRWRDVDLENRVIHVRQQVVELTNGKLEVDAPLKQRKRKRDIPLAPIAYDALTGLARPSDDAHVFTDGRGGPIRRTNFTNREFHPLLESAGIPRFNLHQLRHTLATMLKAAGVDDLTISMILGHANVAITQGVYIDTFHEAKKNAMEKAHGLMVP